MELPCSTISHYESSPFVFWKGLTLEANKRTHSVTEDKDGKNVVTYDTYESVSSFIHDYYAMLLQLLNKHFPDDDFMKVVTALNQALWPRNPDQIKTKQSIIDGLLKWPKVMNLQNEIPDLTEDIDHLIEVLKRDDIKYCKIRTSQPNKFWNLLLVKGVLTPNLVKLVERTLVIPYGTGMYLHTKPLQHLATQRNLPNQQLTWRCVFQ